MREFNALRALPSSTAPRNWKERDIHSKIVASYRDERFFDGERKHGYGGLVNDGRWKRVAEDMMVEYRLFKGDLFCQFGFEKGFLLKEFERIGLICGGVETSSFCLDNYDGSAFVRPGPYSETWYRNKQFDLVVAIGTVYTQTLPEAIKTICEISRIGKRAFITLGSFDTPEDERIMRQWSLLGCTFLSKPDWLEVMKHCGYQGDYWFMTPQSLGLQTEGAST